MAESESCAPKLDHTTGTFGQHIWPVARGSSRASCLIDRQWRISTDRAVVDIFFDWIWYLMFAHGWKMNGFRGLLHIVSLSWCWLEWRAVARRSTHQSLIHLPPQSMEVFLVKVAQLNNTKPQHKIYTHTTYVNRGESKFLQFERHM